MAAHVAGDQKDLVRENVNSQRATDSAALAARQLHSPLLDDFFIQRIEEGERALGRVIKLLWSERVRNVVGEALKRVFGHLLTL